MTAAHIALLLAAGLAAGTVNAIAGGGSLVTFPALLATGLPAVAANVTNSIAVFPGYVGSVVGSRHDLADLAAEDGPHGRRRLLALLPTAVAGTAAGCALLLATPASAFDLVVPFLVLGAAAVLAFQTRLRGLVGHPHDMSPRRRTLSLHGMVFLGSVYGGYFGAALGVMLVAALGLVLATNLARISALKNALSALVGLITLLVFAAFGPVDWADVALLAPATVTGGYVGARVARRLPAPVLRAVIVVFAGAVGLVLLVKAFAR
ncbi:sulfite exporter TauE/SafE family protein [Planosporangium sp. 12N6]|uniref:sulfite exporter TauE/SafE family protein n=1 Tax=Planosporangium spinosum TaxID=3402278 RepID=UPI003CEEB71E